MKYILILVFLSSFSFASETALEPVAFEIKPTPTLSSPLRYPHLNIHLELLSQKEYLGKKRILIAGLGDFNTKDGQRSCPFLHEMLAVFSHKSITVIDFNPLVCQAVDHSIYPYTIAHEILRNFELDSFESYSSRKAKLSSYDPSNTDDFIKALSANADEEYFRDANIIRNIIYNIPQRLPGKVRTLCGDFSNVLSADQFDFIFSINALIYALSNWDGRTATKIRAKPNALEITTNFLNALRPMGNLYIDMRAFDLMRKKLIKMSPSEDLSGFDFEIEKKSYRATIIVPPHPHYKVMAPSYNLQVCSSPIVRIQRQHFTRKCLQTPY